MPQPCTGGRDAEWQDTFIDDARDFVDSWRDLVTDELTAAEDGSPQYQARLLDAGDLRECLDLATAWTGTALAGPEIRIHSQTVASRTADSTAGLEFLNSLIMGDLGLVAEHAAKGDVGFALREYLRPEAEIRVDQRVDVRERIEATLTGTAPDVVPAGRWPSDPAHALALSQQLAVSTALGMGDTGIMGVNGPPGTGKTTMLRDLIAALVVARAARLAALSDPAKAFTSKPFTWLTGGRTRVIKAWRRELTGFEMVVASANNGAVENVTNEIPAADAIDAAWREQAAAVDYFPKIATALLAPDQVAEGKQVSGPDGWALVAARLGNKKNRSRFVSMFWYHKPDEPEDDNPWYGLLHVLKEYEETGPVRPWSAAVADFHAVAARVDAIRAERTTVYRQVQRRARIDEELAELRRSVAAATDMVTGARQRLNEAVAVERDRAAEAEQIMAARRAEAERVARERVADTKRLVQDRAAEVERIVRGRRAHAEQAVRSREHELGRRWDAHAQHREHQPGWWARVRTFGGVSRRWTRQDTWLDAQVRAARQDMATAQRDLDLVQQAVDAAERTVDAARRELDTARHVLVVGVTVPEVVHKPLIAAGREQALAEHNHSEAVRAEADVERALADVEAELVTLDDALKQASDALGRYCPDTDWWTDRERRELAALWTDPAWNRARSELFLAALALHKEFLRHTARVMRGNLQAVMDVVNGDAPADLAADAVLAAWQSLFFVVPVVSTTFASYARLFGHLGTEALGWLLVDEAGQATPQNAVGALWRAKRALVVGDPLQLKPITTLPFPAEQAIRNDFGVDEQWLTSRTSVQQIADRLTPLGTWLPGQDDRTWVGVPLIVHRRCDQPMFDVVNAVAYDGLMIDGTGDGPRTRFDERYPTLPPSKWIDVIGTGARGHWIRDEGHQLDRILDTLVGLEFDMSDVMMIGPFKDIARQLKNRAKPHSGLTAGTIHTAQGKQADVVILVLGSDPERQGARNWASSEPNLLNVAVSRAKRRLYVIGNRTLWGGCRYFRVLAAELPHTAPVVRNELT